MIRTISCSLVASRSDGKNVGKSEFVDLLDVEGFATTSDRGAWASSTVELLTLRCSDFSGDEPYEAFSSALSSGLETTAQWLSRNSRALARRPTELKVMVLLEATIDQDQIDLEIPPVLMSACGQCSASLQIVSNE